jgi:prepilin signal peptidase PulO-like enzyme (type II secretory pathway)
MNILLYFYIFIFGLIIGSFLNCLIWRLHKKESLWGRSYCPKCKKQIAWYDNLPVLSFIFLKGKCRHCGKKISWQYPLVELVTGILFLIAYLRNPISLMKLDFYITLLRDWFLIAVMIVIFVYDLRWYLILDVVTLPAILALFVLNLLLGFSWQNLLISGIIGGSFFFFQFAVSKGKWIGGGDIRLGALMGFALGWPNIIVALFIAYMIGSVVGIYLILTKKKQWQSQVPLGIFLTTATLVTLFWGNQFLSWYLATLGL